MDELVRSFIKKQPESEPKKTMWIFPKFNPLGSCVDGDSQVNHYKDKQTLAEGPDHSVIGGLDWAREEWQKLLTVKPQPQQQDEKPKVVVDEKEPSVSKLDLPERPYEVAMVDAVERVIYDIAPEKMTPIEVLGCLDHISKQFWHAHFGDHE